MIEVTESEYIEHNEEFNGVCLACKEVRWGSTEPDARNYPCEECGANKVVGFEWGLVGGDVVIVDG